MGPGGRAGEAGRDGPGQARAQVLDQRRRQRRHPARRAPAAPGQQGARPDPVPIRTWSAGSTSGSRSTCCSSRWRPRPPRPPGRPSTRCRREPPTWERARAMATYANVLLLFTDDEQAREQAECARQAAKAAERAVGRGRCTGDAGPGQRAERAHRGDVRAVRRRAPAGRAGRVLGVELRAAFHLARVRLERGDLTEAAMIAHQGFSRAEKAGLGPGAVRHRPAVPALPGALRRRRLGSRAGARRRVQRPGQPPTRRPSFPRWRCSSTWPGGTTR